MAFRSVFIALSFSGERRLNEINPKIPLKCSKSFRFNDLTCIRRKFLYNCSMTTKRTTQNGNAVIEGYKGKRGGSWITKTKRLAVYLRDGFACAYCGRELRSAKPFDVTLDHLVPRCTGGTDEPTNLITACRSCNSARQDKPWASYATGGAIDRIQQLRNSPLNLELAKSLIAGTAGDPEIEKLR
jgi:hypothetical protein